MGDVPVCEECQQAIRGVHIILRAQVGWAVLARLCDDSCLADWLWATNRGTRPDILPKPLALESVPSIPDLYEAVSC